MFSSVIFSIVAISILCVFFAYSFISRRANNKVKEYSSLSEALSELQKKVTEVEKTLSEKDKKLSTTELNLQETNEQIFSANDELINLQSETKEIKEYKSKYKIDAILLREEITKVLQNYKTNKNVISNYAKPVNPLGFAAIIKDLQILIKELNKIYERRKETELFC